VPEISRYTLIAFKIHVAEILDSPQSPADSLIRDERRWWIVLHNAIRNIDNAVAAVSVGAVLII
jgi:hypothetical protein